MPLRRPMTDDQLRSAAGEIRLLCLDVDGVLTDGAMYYSPEGEAMKRFHTQDAAGIALARKAGLEIAWISADDSPITAARARKLEIVHLAFGCDDKVPRRGPAAGTNAVPVATPRLYGRRLVRHSALAAGGPVGVSRRCPSPGACGGRLLLPRLRRPWRGAGILRPPCGGKMAQRRRRGI